MDVRPDAVPRNLRFVRGTDGHTWWGQLPCESFKSRSWVLVPRGDLFLYMGMDAAALSPFAGSPTGRWLGVRVLSTASPSLVRVRRRGVGEWR